MIGLPFGGVIAAFEHRDKIITGTKKAATMAGSGISKVAQSGSARGAFIDIGTKETHAAYEHYAPSITHGAQTYAPTIGYAPQTTQSYVGSTYIISSPEAIVKKQVVTEQASAMRQQPMFDIPTIGGATERRGEGDIKGMSVEKIAIIAVIGAAAIVLGGKAIGVKGGKRK